MKTLITAPTPTVQATVLICASTPPALPTLDDTYALLVEAARSACSLRLRFGSQMPWGCSKKAALHEVAASGTASPAYKQHEKNWSRLVKAERIHLMQRTSDGCFYLPDFLLTKNGSDSSDGNHNNSNDWTVNREATQQFVATGAIPTTASALKGEPAS